MGVDPTAGDTECWLAWKAKAEPTTDSAVASYGSIAGQRFGQPIEEFFALANDQPADVDGTYEARMVSVEQVGDAATAAIEETGFWGTLSFTDFFALSRFDGEWKIVNKTFAHTGGEPLAH